MTTDAQKRANAKYRKERMSRLYWEGIILVCVKMHAPSLR